MPIRKPAQTVMSNRLLCELLRCNTACVGRYVVHSHYANASWWPRAPTSTYLQTGRSEFGSVGRLGVTQSGLAALASCYLLRARCTVCTVVGCLFHAFEGRELNSRKCTSKVLFFEELHMSVLTALGVIQTGASPRIAASVFCLFCE